jgi:polysaccharide deacetylase 2 family uncharacterized protein YibQ
LAVAADDLSAPLGQDDTPKRHAIPLAVPRVAVAVLSLFIVVLAAWAMVVDDPFGGEPWAVAPTNLAAGGPAKSSDAANARPPGPAPIRADGAAAEAPQPLPSASKTVTIIDGTSGKRQEIVLAGPTDDKSALGLDPRLTEASRHGPLPKIAADGSRVSDLYARTVRAIPAKPNAPRVAIVVAGLGVGAAATADALGKLPGPVTLALAPYGSNLAQLSARARSEGHEVLLQVPMEPFDYPDNDPGPQTLLTSLDAGQNVDRLQWLMSRFQGYVGIVNNMGGRFTSSEPALAPVLREAGKRGLIYLDDGSSQRSVARDIAGAHNIGFVRADLVIDAVPAGAEVDRALGRLETMARERGIAVGIASALPVSVERIAKWAKAAEGRGVLLVPITAVAKRTTDDGQRTTDNARPKS